MGWIGVGARQLFAARGEQIRWWRSTGACPCYNPLDGTFNSADPLCQGTGTLYEEVSIPNYLALITSASNRKDYIARFGNIQAGDLICSTYTEEIPINYGDVVVVPSRTAVFSDVITASGGPDKLSQLFATTIERVVFASGPVVYGYSVSVTTNGTSTINWTAGTGPIAGARYTVRYRYNPRYTSFGDGYGMRGSDPAAFGSTGQSRPQRMLLRLMNQDSQDPQ